MSLSERIRSGCEAAPWVSDEVQNLEATNAELCDEVQNLEAMKAELLEAFEEIMNQTDQRSKYLIDHVYLIARAAIAKAKGESNE